MVARASHGPAFVCLARCKAECLAVRCMVLARGLREPRPYRISLVPIRLVLMICLLVPALAAAREGRRAPEDWAARTKREAIGLFKAVLPEMKRRRQPCFFENSWETGRPISADIAKKFLGSNMEADLVATHLGIGTQDILDPDKVRSGSFCEKDEADRRWKQQMEAFREGRLPGEINPHGPEELAMTRAELSMPVFDRAFTTAVIVVGYHTVSLQKVSLERAKESPRSFDEKGYSRREFPEGFGYTQVYRKRRSTWVRIFEHEDWSAN